ncbi:MAG: hypothetical protein ACKOBW_02045, partial [Planctomycetota bacterium]
DVTRRKQAEIELISRREEAAHLTRIATIFITTLSPQAHTTLPAEPKQTKIGSPYMDKETIPATKPISVS